MFVLWSVWQMKNVSQDAVQGKIGKIYMQDQKVSGKFIHLVVVASTVRYLVQL